ncbi:MAG: HAD family phosphatase [Ruminococcaceae bacterium]|nr:HAD family phosphatase [Oscillospiraceae bacterium]
MTRLIAFDLDGTLTQHKSQLDEKNRAVLDRLRAHGYTLLMVGAGQCRRIYDQMGQYSIDIIGNYGLQMCRYNTAVGDLETVYDLTLPCDRESVKERIIALRHEFGYTEYSGEFVEFHPSGAVTFPILGTTAKLSDKLAFDPDRSKRRRVYSRVVDAFPEYTVFVGGSSSFDMAPKPYDKYYALNKYCSEHGFFHDEVIFAGDDYGIGGNDESVYKSDFGFICVDDYTRLENYLKDLL